MDWGVDPSAGRGRGSAGAPPDPLVDAVESAIVALQGSDPAELAAEALGQRVVRMEGLVARLHAHEVDCVATMDTRGDAAALRSRSTQAWLRRVARVAPGAAKALVTLARRLPAAPATGAAFTAGRVGLRHAQVLARTVEELRPRLTGEAELHQTEQALVEVAVLADPLRLADACKRVRIAAAPDRAVADDWTAFNTRYLNISRTLDGMVAGEFLLDPATGEAAMAAIHALSAPAGPDDDRTPGQRRADALGEISRRVLGFTELPTTGGERPQVTVTVPIEVLEDRARRAAVDRLAESGVTGELAWAGPISGEAARRLCCDAMITRIVADGPSQPLDVGRATRVVPAGMRRALLLRDRTCAYPGCDMPGVWCDAHHRRHWALGGETKLSNLVLLCGYHHTRLHLAGEWIQRHPDGTIEIITDPHPHHHDAESPLEDTG